MHSNSRNPKERSPGNGASAAKIILLSVVIVLVLLAVISRHLPPAMPAHQHVGP
jgi:hypothetical protein